jgi:HD superfamily phosphodiesterase
MRWRLLKTFPEIKRPFPIYRICRVPIWEDGKISYVKELNDKDYEYLKKALQILKELISHTTYQNEGEKLRTIADMIAVFFKAPLILELSPLEPSPLKAQILLAALPDEVLKAYVDDIYEFAKNLSSLSEVLGRFSSLFTPETAEIIYRIWISFPADTRPGFNSSSLASHLLTTSAFAWCFEYGKGGLRESTARVAAMLHDIGKAFDPENHVEASLEVAKYLLEEEISGESFQVIANLIREHHKHGNPLKLADEKASAVDRLSLVVEATIGEKIKKIEQVLGLSSSTWEFWRKTYEYSAKLMEQGIVKDNPIKELSEEFLKKLMIKRECITEIVEKGFVPEVSLVLVDVGGIQDFIYSSEELRSVAAASRIIDLCVHAHFLFYLRNKGIFIPPEAIIFSGGGQILMLLPSKLADQILALEEKYFETTHIRVYMAKTLFYPSYWKSSEILAKEIYKKKLNVKIASSLTIQPLSFRLCEFCYSEWAVDEVELPDGRRKYTCRKCGKLYEVGSEIHFPEKWRSKLRLFNYSFSPKEVFDKEWRPEIARWIMEIIAGHSPEEIQELGRKISYRDLAVVKFDGNEMGKYMRDSLSFTEVAERSFRVDLALKKAYLKTLNAVYEGIKQVAGEEEAGKVVSQVYLGTIYMGGDDGVILMPSWISILFAHKLAEEFMREIGLERGITISVVAGKSKMNIWSLLDCSMLLLEVGKKVAKKFDGEGRVSAVVFDLYESGSPSGYTAREKIYETSRRVQKELLNKSKLDEKVDGLQPYLIKPDNILGNLPPELWQTFIPLILGIPSRKSWSENEAEEEYRLAFGKTYLISRFTSLSSNTTIPSLNEEQNERKRIKNVRRAILESLMAVSPSNYWREKLLVFVARQRLRASEEAEIGYAYEDLQLFIKKYLQMEGMDRKPVPIADALVLIKLFTGGVVED